MTRPECSIFQRRDFLRCAGGGMGMIALQSLLRREAAAETKQSESRNPHFAPRAKRMIWLFMHGGPSHVDLFDPKPELIRLAGQTRARQFRHRDDAAQGRDKIRCCRRSDRFGRADNRACRFPIFCRTSVNWPMIVRDSVVARRQCQSSAVGVPNEYRQHFDGTSQSGQLACLRPGQRKTRTCRPLSCLPDPGGGLKGGPSAWGSGYLPATYQGTTMRAGEDARS